ncbi:MAG: PIN domain-containing protein [Sphingomonadales bacterium]|nr:MAG: PIN domain-containing protein [Sphingomonadales bacterium]
MASFGVYVDANIVIRLIEVGDDEIRSFVEHLQARDGEMITSELTLTEVLVAPLRKTDDGLVKHYEAFLQSGGGVSMIPVSRTILRRSAELRALFHHKTPDAIHVASAEASGCRLFVSADKRLNVPETLMRITVDERHRLDRLP